MKFLTIAGACALAAGSAQAGGFERSGLPLGFLFETGNYVELSFGSVSPDVSGSLIPAPAVRTGDVTGSYTSLGFAIKTDLTDKLSLGLTIDPSFGADIAYPTGTGYPLAGSTAKLRGDTIAAVARYKINENISVHGGLRSVGIGGNLALVTSDGLYRASFSNDRDIGYLVGAAYERPEIALRVALTYASDTDHSMTTSVAGAPVTFQSPVTLPESLTLDFQSGVAADTLVFGSIRWVDWTSTTLNGPLLPATINPLVSYSNDTITYSIGVGRKFTEAFSGAVSIGYEKTHGDVVGNLGPTDGFKSIQIGGTYTRDNMKISAGVRYIDIGNATALRPTSASTTGNARFSDNHAIAFGMKVGFTF